MTQDKAKIFEKMIGIYMEKFRDMNRRFEFKFEDLTRQDVRLLEFVQNCPECSMSDFIDYFEIDNPTKATRYIDRLVKSGFIERFPSKKDRRKILLNLTSKAENLMLQRQKEIFNYFSKVFSKLTVEDLEYQIKILNKLEVDQ